MGVRENHAPGLFCWVDLLTTDEVAARRFYEKLFGWQYDARAIGDDANYSLALRAGKRVAAIAPLMADLRERGVPPHWQSYINVENVDAMVERARAYGGKTFCDPFDVFDAGRMCTVVDPTGAAVNFWQAGKSIGAEWVNDPGSFGWNELGTRDLPRAKEFWGAVMGWTFEEQMLGSAPYYVIKNGSRMNGGMHDITNKVPDFVPAHWNVYFTVAELEASLKIVTEQGGKVLVPPVSIGVGRIAVISDPTGATLTLYEGRVEE
jgi:predicted enzyme related to lactoylglutathione lyase